MVLPRGVVVATIVVTALPFLLNLAGVDFSSRSTPIDTAAGAVSADDMFQSLRGAFHHVLLEWSAPCIALLTCALAFTNYATRKDALPSLRIVMEETRRARAEGRLESRACCQHGPLRSRSQATRTFSATCQVTDGSGKSDGRE